MRSAFKCTVSSIALRIYMNKFSKNYLNFSDRFLAYLTYGEYRIYSIVIRP